jgi:pimeloyl-ACP methyl ester carboxylesterase
VDEQLPAAAMFDTHLEQDPKTRLFDNSAFQAPLLVVYLHGVAEPPLATSFPRFIGRARDVRLVSIQQPGFDGMPELPMDPEAQARYHLGALKHLIDQSRVRGELAHKRVMLVAHSAGNRPAYGIKARWSESEMGLPLVASVESATPQRPFGPQGQEPSSVDTQKHVERFAARLQQLPQSRALYEFAVAARTNLAFAEDTYRLMATGIAHSSWSQLARGYARIMDYATRKSSTSYLVGRYASTFDSTSEIKANRGIPTALIRGERDLICTKPRLDYVQGLLGSNCFSSITIPGGGHSNFALDAERPNALALAGEVMELCIRKSPTFDELAAAGARAQSIITGQSAQRLLDQDATVLDITPGDRTRSSHDHDSGSRRARNSASTSVPNESGSRNTSRGIERAVPALPALPAFLRPTN